MSGRKLWGSRHTRKLPVSTFVVGGLVLLFAVAGASAWGAGGILLMLSIVALLTGLYVVVTGRRSWAGVRGGRKAGAVVLAASAGLFIAGSALSPLGAAESLGASTASKNGTAWPKPTPSGETTGDPLDPATAAEPGEGVSIAAAHPEPRRGTKAIDLLATLSVKGRAPKTGYDRAQFGEAWTDVDRNGCDTRNDILKRDLTDITFTNSVACKVQSGKLADPYTGKTIAFLRGSATSTAVQIDHVVALSDAWQKGAQQLTLLQRTAFANDPLNLQATDGPTNVQKGDGDAATWLPPNKPFRCEYVAPQISVKATYDLWVTQAEHDAMARILSDCPSQLAPTNEKASAAAAPSQSALAQVAHSLGTSTFEPAAARSCCTFTGSSSYANCAGARAAGVALLGLGQPPIRRALSSHENPRFYSI